MQSTFHKMLIYRITSQVTSQEQVILMRLCFKDASSVQWWEKHLSKWVFIKLTSSWCNKYILWKLLSMGEANIFLCKLDWYWGFLLLGSNIIQKLNLYQFDVVYLAWFGLQDQLHNNLLDTCCLDRLTSQYVLYVHIILLFYNIYVNLYTQFTVKVCITHIWKKMHAYCGIHISKNLRMPYGLVNRHCLIVRENQNSGK